MKLTIDIPKELDRTAQAKAARRGCKVDDVIQEGLRLVLASSREHDRPSLFELMKHACGIINSGIADLASNSEHLLASFGRKVHRDR